MRESAFVKQNLDRWQASEKLIEDKQAIHPDKVAELYIKLTDDLAFAKSHFPKAKTTSYLNELTSRFHHNIYRNKKEKGSRFITFWKYEVPLAFAESYKEVLYSFLFFAAGTLIGVLSTLGDESFIRVILGDVYVDHTLENISNGDPLGIYGESGQVSMFFSITINNIAVSFNAFVRGIIFTVGAVYIIFSNGIMLGAFFTMFFQHGLLSDSLLVVLLHGTIELSAIVLAGGAGIVLGNSLLFPGTYSRVVSLKKGAKKGLKMIVGLIPFFIIAGFIESFITRYTHWHWAGKLSIIIISLFILIYYFFVLPYNLKNRKDAGETQD
ncbi:stage II sporulation protein M [Roseivirga sp. BDSF3-8]|uniref:stage II sporulation protein M n=1 Tax=Roseivirga sp. BDSF3-8 TaxID=3241598 RepID=UPI003531D4AC